MDTSAAPNAQGMTLNRDQEIALEVVAEWLARPKGEAPKLALTGAAGTGKTVCLAEIRRRLADNRDRDWLWTAMTGKAASRMIDAAGLPAVTLHRALYAPPTVDDKTGEPVFGLLREPPYGSVLVIDEASMVTPQIESDLDRWIREDAVRVLFVGDAFQLPPVISRDEARTVPGGEDYSVFATLEGAVLQEVMRNGDSILDAATMLRARGKMPTVSAKRPGYEFAAIADPMEAAIVAYLTDPHDHALITWTNRSRMLANQIIRSRLGFHGETPQPGEPILVCRNASWRSDVVLSGEVYEVARVEPGPRMGPVPTYFFITACGRSIFAHGYGWTGDAPFIEDRDEWRAYRRAIDANVRAAHWGGLDHPPEPVPVTYGHVLTAHKAQGSEYRRVTVFMTQAEMRSSHFRKLTKLPDGSPMPFATRWFYTAVTRAKARCTVLVGR